MAIRIFGLVLSIVILSACAKDPIFGPQEAQTFGEIDGLGK